jgi:hypothetical protein
MGNDHELCLRIWKEGARGLFEDTILVFTWKDWENPREMSIKIFDNMMEIETIVPLGTGLLCFSVESK